MNRRASDVPNEPQQREISLDAILQALNQQRTYAQLCRYVNTNAIPELICIPDDTLRQEETYNLGLCIICQMTCHLVWLLYKQLVMVTVSLEQ